MSAHKLISWLCRCRKLQAMPGVPRCLQRHYRTAFKNCGYAAILKSHRLCRWMLTIGLSIGISVLGIVCTKEKSVSGIEITNGNCVGTIYHSNGAPADGVVVRLIPRDYNPFSPTDSLLDSAVTDQYGRFSFNAKQLRRYNIIARKAAASCMDSIELIPNATTIVIDTLRQSGFISGAVRLQKPDTANSIVVLVMGSSIFTMPSDTSGKFTTPLLAAGSYTLRFFSTQSGYAVFDTVVIVDKGAETKLPVIFLLSANAPSVSGFSVTFDSLTMYATLAWSLSNTDSIVSYSLHRTSKNGNDSLFVIDKSLTSIIEDILLYEGDTLTYQIAANGKNFKEGFRSKPLTVVARQKVRWDKRTVINWDISRLYDVVSFFVDSKENLFLADYQIIQKLDANGNALNQYVADSGTDFSGYIYSFTQSPQIDDFGNVYVNQFYDVRHKIIKLDADLNKRKEMILGDSSAESPSSLTIAVTGGGNVLVISDSSGAPYSDTASFSRRVTVYDSNFTPHDDYGYSNVIPIMEVTRFGETFAATERFSVGIDLPYFLGWFDQKFNALSSVKNFDYVNKFIPATYHKAVSPIPFAGPGGLIFTPCAVDSVEFPFPTGSLFIVSTADKKLVARFLLPVMDGACFDQAGNYYWLVTEQVDGNSVEVVYRYPLAQFFGAAAASGSPLHKGELK